MLKLVGYSKVDDNKSFIIGFVGCYRMSITIIVTKSVFFLGKVFEKTFLSKHLRLIIYYVTKTCFYSRNDCLNSKVMVVISRFEHSCFSLYMYVVQ